MLICRRPGTRAADFRDPGRRPRGQGRSGQEKPTSYITAGDLYLRVLPPFDLER
jgi:hypothetical protein